jgi:hypothetical protein
MRVPAMLIAASFVLTAPAPLLAQGDIRLGLAAGISIPIRSYSDLVDKGWLGTGSLTFFPAASASIGFRLEGMYARNSISFTDGHQTQVGGTANLVFQFGARRSPNRFYVFGGGGFVRSQTSGPGFGTVSTTDPALNAGVGVSFGARAIAFFGEARYVSVYTDGTKPQYAPILAGISFGGL